MRSALGLTTIAMNCLTDQREIVRRVESLFALADQLELRLARFPLSERRQRRERPE
jgi:hypothetical protein